MSVISLKSPSYKKISYAATLNKGISLTVINLGSYKTIKVISKNEVVATGKINSTNVECKALESLKIGASEIYVLIPGINYTGKVSLKLQKGIISSQLSFTADNCTNIYSLFYGENFDLLSSANQFCSTTNITPNLINEGSSGKYLESVSLDPRTGNLESIVDLKVPSSGSYIIEFDAAIANTAIDDPTAFSNFGILTEKNNLNSYLLKLSTNTRNDGKNKMTWYINDTKTSVVLDTNFYHYTFIVDRKNNQLGLSINSLKNEVLLANQIIKKNPIATSDIAKSFRMDLPRKIRGLIRLNNISVYSYENAQIKGSSSPSLKAKVISLSSYVSLIISVNKSLYCNSSFKDTQLTLESLKEGKTYIYVDSILKDGETRALVLLIVKVDSKGEISYENPYILCTDLNFNKRPTTIQKAFKTYSSIDNLDSSEPKENSKVTPCVTLEQINSKFSQFDNEKSIKPKVKVSFCNTNKKWVILYTKDSKITEYSEYILYDKYFDGLLDCINESFTLLTSNRNVKEKISIITDGSTGTVSQNLNSFVNAKDRMYGSAAIIPQNYTILDFEEHYIYVDYKEKYKNSSGKEFSIGCFINIERQKHDITIRNLNLFGTHNYGVYVAGSSHLLFQNINVFIAEGESISGFIGIRCQSQGTAITNLDHSRWSHDLYFDNCTFNGLIEHGIETYNAYNIYATTIKATDVKGCGVLLNSSYNAWIYSIIGVRCAASGSYASLRCANEVGPNVNVHYVYGEACGHGVFLVSSSNNVTIDKVNLLNIHTEPVFVSGSGGLHIKSGKILTNGGEIKYHENGVDGKTTANTNKGTFFVNGTSSQYFPQWNNILENLKISGFKYGLCERYNMSSNYNVYNNIDTSGCTNSRFGEKNGTGTVEDVPFGFCVFDGKKGVGNEIATGNIIKSGDYSYSLNSNSTSYIIMEYTGTESVVIIPKKFQGKPVSRIGSFAFYGNKNLMAVTIDSNITSLGGLSFGDCPSLKKVTFMNGGSYEIGHCAFRGCEKLSDVNLTGVKILRASCFAWCKSLKTLNCPKSVVYFGGNCFYGDNIDITIECDNIKSMTVEPYAFFYIGDQSKVTFKNLQQPTTLTSVSGDSAKSTGTYFTYSHSYVEKNVYKPGVWCNLYYHVRLPLNFK